MAFVTGFLFSTLFIFIDIEPFTIAGVYLSICYLPGLALLVIGRKRLLLEDLILAFPFSIGISSVLILTMLFSGIHAGNILLIMHILLGGVCIYYVLDSKKRGSFVALKLDKKELKFCVFAFFLTMLLSVPFLVGPNRIGIAGHAFHHSLLVSQIMNGTFPPENPGMGGTIIGYYWGFHGLIAVLTAKSNYQQIQIIFILNVLSLYFVFCVCYVIARMFGISESYRYILPLAVIGLIKFDSGVWFFLNLLTWKLQSIQTITATPVEPYDVLMSWLGGLPKFDTRLMFLRKFYNISGMPLAVCLCFSYLLLLLLEIRERPIASKRYLIGIGLVISACFFNYPPLAIFMLLHAPLWSGFLFLSNRGTFKEKIKETARVFLPYMLSIVIVLPYMFFVIASRDVSSSGQGGIFRIDIYEQSWENIIGFVIPFPVILYGIRVALKKISFSREMVYLLIGTALSAVLSIFTRWPFDNSYKFNYILTFYFALFFMFGLSGWISVLKRMWLKRLIVTCAVISLLLPTLIVEASSIVSSLSTHHIYKYSNGHIMFSEDRKNEAYTWIRENTPPGTLIMLGYIESNWPCCGMNNNYEPAAIMERALYVIKDRDYTTSNPEYEKRVYFREKLLENSGDPQVQRFFASLNRPVFLLVEEDTTGRFLVEERFKSKPLQLNESFVLKFQNDRQRVYEVRIDK